jgi:hypothetical protein
MSNALSEPMSTSHAAARCPTAALWFLRSQLDEFLRSQLDEMQRTFDWLKSWGMPEATVTPFDLVNLDVHTERIRP